MLDGRAPDITHEVQVARVLRGRISMPGWFGSVRNQTTTTKVVYRPADDLQENHAIRVARSRRWAVMLAFSGYIRLHDFKAGTVLAASC